MDKADFYRQARQDLPGPLAGLRVLEATTTWAGPMCACILADFGADVIKVELPDGEVIRRMPPFLPDTTPPLSFGHATVNRNKRGLSLDLRTPEGRDLFLRFASRSDIVVENFRPGTMQKWGIGYTAVCAVKPDIIYVSITGFGQFGPAHDRPGYDPLAQAASGFISLNGEASGNPVKAGTAIADDLGGVHGALATLAAVYHHRRTGEGQHVDVALLDSLLFQSNGFLTLGALGLPLPRWGNEYPFAVPANIFMCKDGRVYLALLLDAHWKVLAQLMGRTELAEDPEYFILANRLRRRDEINALVAHWCSTRLVDEVVSLLTNEGISVAPVRTYTEAANDPHVRARDMLQATTQFGHPALPVTGPAAKFSRTPTRVRMGAPMLGAHDEEILLEFGLLTAEIDQLRRKKVIAQNH